MDNVGLFMIWFVVEAAILLVAIGIFVAALETGYRLGKRRQVKTDEPDKTHANALHGATLGLLALLLGFSFAMAVSRYENRKTLMVDQANAIGTAALRGSLLAQPHADRTAALFRDYVDSRFLYNASVRGSQGIDEAEARASKIETELWNISRILLTEDPRAQPASLFTQALNEMFDIREKRRFALDDRVPGSVIFLLFAISAVAMALVAYSCGLSGRRRGIANFTFASLIALVLVIILDIDAPRVGFVKVSQGSLIRLQQSLPAAP
jgi:hypothetical protein